MKIDFRDTFNIDVMKEFINKTIGPLAFLLLYCGFFVSQGALPCLGDEFWGASLFKVKRHDFGRVALGADAEYRFVFENGFLEDIRIVDAQSSCSCTSVSIPKRSVKSKEKGEIVAKLNTTGQHLRDKSATLTVHVESTVGGRILRDSVQLFVTGYIRPDVVLTPGIVEFGSVLEGETVVRQLRLDYTGRSDWALTKIERGNPFVHARAEEIKRNHGDISYKITVALRPGAPVGYVKDALRFTTNEQSSGSSKFSEIVLPIQGVVMAPIHAKPAPFLVGLITPGESVVKSLVVRSETPFRILGVDAADKHFRFSFAKQESNIQIVSVLFSATSIELSQPIDMNSKIRIRTNLPDREFVTLDALVRITPKYSVPPDLPEAAPDGLERDMQKTEIQGEVEVSLSEPRKLIRTDAAELSYKNNMSNENRCDDSRSTIEPVVWTTESENRKPMISEGKVRFGRPKTLK